MKQTAQPKMTEKEIALETFEYYKTHPYGFDEGDSACIYSDKARKKRCAVGRCISPAAVEKKLGFSPHLLSGKLVRSMGDSSARGLSTYLTKRELDLDSILLPRYRGHSIKFWDDMQTWHDLMADPTIQDEDVVERIEKKYRSRKK
jgi:hypothetical protein